MEATPLRSVPHLERSVKKIYPILCFVCIASLLSACGVIPPTRDWHPKKPVLQYNAEPWSVTYFQPPKVEFSTLKRIRIGDSEDTIRSFIGEYPAHWNHGSAVLTEIDGRAYEVAYLYRDGTGFIEGISYKALNTEQDGGGNSAALRASP